MEGKKDVLEFPLEELEVPQAIAMMMLSATKCVGFNHEVTIADFEGGNFKMPVDNDRLQLLCEKLDARIDDELDKVRAIRDIPAEEDAPNEVEIEPGEIFLMNDDLIINYKGLLYHRSCNQPVAPETEGSFPTYCMKVADHRHPDHEDIEGNIR